MCLTTREGSEKAACTAMSACVQGSQWPRALWLLQGCQPSPDTLSLTTAMSACGRGRHWRGTLHIWQEIQALSCADVVFLDLMDLPVSVSVPCVPDLQNSKCEVASHTLFPLILVHIIAEFLLFTPIGILWFSPRIRPTSFSTAKGFEYCPWGFGRGPTLATCHRTVCC